MTHPCNDSHCKLCGLAREYNAHHEAIIACDPSVSPEALEEFHELQEWGDELEAEIIAAGFDLDQVEALALCL